MNNKKSSIYRIFLEKNEDSELKRDKEDIDKNLKKERRILWLLVVGCIFSVIGFAEVISTLTKVVINTIKIIIK